MPLSVHIDSRLVLPCLTEAGLAGTALREAHELLAALLSGQRASPAQLASNTSKVGGRLITFHIQWDSIKIDVDSAENGALAIALKKFSNPMSPEILESLKNATARSVRELDSNLRAVHCSIDGLRNGSSKITPDVANVLLETHSTSVNRVLHEEIAGLMGLPIIDKKVRVLLGRFLLMQFPLPAKRTHRFLLCQALTNLAEPELGEGIATLLRDMQYASLRGRLCEALAHTSHPDAARSIAAALEDGDDETKLYAIEALAQLKASHYKVTVRGYLNYQSPDKEWTRTIKKAAEKALKRMG